MRTFLMLLFILGSFKNAQSQVLSSFAFCDSLFFIDFNGDLINEDEFSVGSNGQGRMVLNLTINVNDQSKWNFLTSSGFLEFHNTYGPNGTNQFALTIRLRVDENEFDASPSMIYGSYPSVGDWSQIIPNGAYAFPMIPFDGSFVFDFAVCYWNNIFLYTPNNPSTGSVCITPEGAAYRLGSVPTLVQLQNMLGLLDTLNGVRNAKILYHDLDTASHCEGYTRTGNIWVTNNGTEPITDVTLGLAWNGVEQDTVMWQGNIKPYYTFQLDSLRGKEINMGEEDGVFSVYIKSVNGQPDLDTSNDTVQVFSLGPVAVESDSVTVEWKTSNFNEEVYVDLVTEDNTILWSTGNPTVLNGPFQNIDTFQNFTTTNIELVSKDLLTIVFV